MQHPGRQAGSIAIDTFRKSQTDVLALKSKLPKDAVGGIVAEVLSRVRQTGRSNAADPAHPPRARIERLCYALIAEEAEESTLFVSDLREDGVDPDTIYLSYLAEAAQVLGEWWDDNHVSFQEVMLGSSRIYAIMRSLSHLFVPQGPVESKAAIFAAVPGETHTLGVKMAADLFGREGWDVDLKLGLSHEELIADIMRNPRQIIGLSAGGRHATIATARLVIALRLSVPGARVFIGGQICQEAQDVVSVMDVDASAADLDAAKQVMESLWQDLAASAA